MRGIIVESDIESATNTDILQGTRLQTVPSNGVLSFEVSSDLGTAAANYTASVQLPDGQTPMTNVFIPASGTIGSVSDWTRRASGVLGCRNGDSGSCLASGIYPKPSVVLAVTATLQLPDVPSPAGQVRFVALGGNGFAAPKAMYTVRNFSVNGDATGDDQTLSVIMDPTYCSMIGYCSMQIATSAANRAIHWAVAGPTTPAALLNATISRIDGDIDGSQIAHTWMPPALINPGGADEVPTLKLSVLNIDTEILNLQCTIFLFDIRARESAIYANLIAARGGMYMSSDD